MASSSFSFLSAERGRVAWSPVGGETFDRKFMGIDERAEVGARLNRLCRC